MDTLPVPKTIAFGGVPTGSINAQLAAIAAGSINASGCTSTAIASPARTGRIIVAVAVFDVNSVRKRIISETIPKIGRASCRERGESAAVAGEVRRKRARD